MPPMPPIPPMPPMPPIPGAPAGSSFGISVTTASAVVSKEATPEASVNAVRTTFIKLRKFQYLNKNSNKTRS